MPAMTGRVADTTVRALLHAIGEPAERIRPGCPSGSFPASADRALTGCLSPGVTGDLPRLLVGRRLAPGYQAGADGAGPTG